MFYFDVGLYIKFKYACLWVVYDSMGYILRNLIILYLKTFTF